MSIQIEETHVIHKGFWYPLYFFIQSKKYNLHGPLKEGGALDFLYSASAVDLKDAYSKAEKWLKKFRP